MTSSTSARIKPKQACCSTAAFDREGMHAAHEVNGPRFGHAILTTDELLALLPASAQRASASQAA
jgi:hypothetical protein